MSISVKQILILSFILANLTSFSVLSYTIYIYFGTGLALRLIKASVSEIHVSNANENESNITTIITLSNPSSFSFEITYVKETLLFNGDSIKEQSLSLVNKPRPMPPFSTQTISINTVSTEPPSLLKYGRWDVYISIFLSTPLPELHRLYFADSVMTGE